MIDLFDVLQSIDFDNILRILLPLTLSMALLFVLAIMIGCGIAALFEGIKYLKNK